MLTLTPPRRHRWSLALPNQQIQRATCLSELLNETPDLLLWILYIKQTLETFLYTPTTEFLLLYSFALKNVGCAL
jgi:hypothetical protein